MQKRCSILPSIAEKTKREVEKHSCKNSACSQCGVTWQTDAIGFQKCDLGLPSHLIPPRQLTSITVRELSNTTSYNSNFQSSAVTWTHFCVCIGTE
jgi:hypothetical protein